jgi:acyl dehydratase
MPAQPDQYQFIVEASAIRRFAEAAWDENEIYRPLDQNARVAAPPTFLGAAATMVGRQHSLVHLGFDVARSFHGSEAISVYAPVVDGMRLHVTETYEPMAGVEGARGGHMRRGRRRSTFFDCSGARVAVVDRILLEASRPSRSRASDADLEVFNDGLAVRNDPSLAAPVPVETLGANDELRAGNFGPLTLTDIVRYAAASGDLTAIHFDPHVARDAGYPAPFAMGMLSAAFVGHMLTDWIVLVPPWRLEVRFRDLLWPGESLTVAGTVRSASADGVVIEVRCGSRGRLVTAATVYAGRIDW